MNLPYKRHPHRFLWELSVIVSILLVCWFIARNDDTKRSMPPITQKTSASSELVASSAVPSRMIEADPAETQLAAKDNAATEWRKAFALAEKLTLREEDILTGNSMVSNLPRDDEIAALLEKIDPIISLLRKGAEKSDCDWGNRNLKFGKDHNYIPDSETLANIAIWDATQQLTRNANEAVFNLIALSHLGMSLNQSVNDGFYNTEIHRKIADFLGQNASVLTPSHRRQLLSGLDSVALVQSLMLSLMSEFRGIENVISAYQNGVHSDGTPLSENERKLFSSETVAANEENLKDRQQIKGLAALLDQSVYWPDERFATFSNKFQPKEPRGEMMASMADIYSNTRGAVRRAIVTQSMVRAGLAVMDQGFAVLKTMLDPLTGKPFSSLTIDKNGTFELQSEVINKLHDNSYDKPVTLTFKMTPVD